MRKHISLRLVPLSILLSLFLSNLIAQTIYVDQSKGKDENPGSVSSPFKSLEKALAFSKGFSGSEPIDIKLARGLYMLSDILSIESELGKDKNPLTLEALVMPDDSTWTPAAMPVIGSNSFNNDNIYFTHCVGLLVARSNVTIRGLKFLGNANPTVDYYYPISKDTLTLPNLNISQCYFIGEKNSVVVQGAIYVEGPGIHVDHCIFYGCKNAVLAFQNLKDFSITHCIIHSAYESAIWYNLKDADPPFTFSNNIVTNSRFVWSAAKGIDHSGYEFNNCLFTDNENYIGEQDGNGGVVKYATPPVIKENNVRKSGNVKLIEVKVDGLPKDYLNLTQDSEGKDLQAGIHKY